MSQWNMNHCGGEYNSSGGVSGASTNVARSGHYAARLHLPDTGSRQQGVRLVRWCESQHHTEAYYSAWYYFPRAYTVNYWWGVMQWKSADSAGRQQSAWMVGVNSRNGQMYLRLWDYFNRRGHDQWTTPLPVGRWVHIEGYYRKAADNTGQVTIWQDGKQILHAANIKTIYTDNVHWSVINYGERLNPATVTIYADDAAISTRRVGE